MDRQISEEPLTSIFRRLLLLTSPQSSVGLNTVSNPNLASLDLILPRLCGLAGKEVSNIISNFSSACVFFITRIKSHSCHDIFLIVL